MDQRSRSRSTAAGRLRSVTQKTDESGHELLQIFHRSADLRGRAVDPDLRGGTAVAAGAADFRIPGSGAADGSGARAISGSQSQGHRRDRIDAHRRADQWGRGHALHEQPGHHRRADDAQRHVPTGHRSGQGAAAGAEPGGAGRAEIARGGSHARHHHDQERARPYHGGAFLLPNGRYDMTYLRNYAVLNVKDRLARIEGVGQVQLFGSGDYSMRIWLDPQKVAERGLSASDVVREIRAQNVQAAAGVVGASPSEVGLDLQLSINAQGRLRTEEEFGEIIVKNGANGEVTRLRDIARIELGAADYSLRSLLDNKSAVAVPIFQSPGSNAIQISDNVRKMMVELKQNMPDGMDYSIVYDPTQFVRASIEAVVHTLLEAVALVVLVVILFLQTWRASIIPLIAVPVSIIGTFAVMHIFGFSINALTLFGLVLAIGIVVDDAIVVVENVERNIEQGLSPKDAAYQAMHEVTGPIIAIALVLIAVFVPLAFITGLTGQFYKQFALTVAISTVISAFNSLTLSPALAALLLKSHDAPKDALTRGMDRLLGWFFRRFNRAFHRSSDAYSGGVKRVISRRAVAMVAYVALIGVTYGLFKAVPGGFVPGQDKQYLVGFAQLPDGATLDRTEEVIRRMGDIALKLPGIESAVAFPGLSINGFTNSSNSGIVFVTLKPFDERKDANLSAGAIAKQLNAKFAAIQEAFIAMFPPPPVAGLGTIGGFKLQIEDRAGLGYDALNDVTKAFIAKASAAPELAGLFSSYQVNVPQLYADIDRTKARQLSVPVTSVFDTMQIYLGSLYVNDFNKFGRTYSVRVQATLDCSRFAPTPARWCRCRRC